MPNISEAVVNPDSEVRSRGRHCTVVLDLASESGFTTVQKLTLLPSFHHL